MRSWRYCAGRRLVPRVLDWLRRRTSLLYAGRTRRRRRLERRAGCRTSLALGAERRASHSNRYFRTVYRMYHNNINEKRESRSRRRATRNRPSSKGARRGKTAPGRRGRAQVPAAPPGAAKAPTEAPPGGAAQGPKRRPCPGPALCRGARSDFPELLAPAVSPRRTSRPWRPARTRSTWARPVQRARAGGEFPDVRLGGPPHAKARGCGSTSR